jgi:ubiquinone/menaquinone biosynthesis C-methylase UbiE
MRPNVNYDAIASAYDWRYLHNDYSGVEQALMGFVGRNRDTRVLEVGCGTGHWLGLLKASSFHVVGLDASIGMLGHAQAQLRGRLVHGDAEHLPFARESFDRVFCINAIHHFRHKAAFLSEARRVLRPGGRMMTIGLDPHTGMDQWYIYDYFGSALQTDRDRYPAASQIREWMQAVAFTECVTHEVQHLPVRLSARTALAEGRLDKTVSSQLSVLTDEQYTQGMDRIRTSIESAEAQGDSLYLAADLRLYATFAAVPV